MLSEKEVKIVLPDDCVFGHEERAVNVCELNFTPSVDQRNRPEKVQKKWEQQKVTRKSVAQSVHEKNYLPVNDVTFSENRLETGQTVKTFIYIL